MYEDRGEEALIAHTLIYTPIFSIEILRWNDAGGSEVTIAMRIKIGAVVGGTSAFKKMDGHTQSPDGVT